MSEFETQRTWRPMRILSAARFTLAALTALFAALIPTALLVGSHRTTHFFSPAMLMRPALTLAVVVGLLIAMAAVVLREPGRSAMTVTTFFVILLPFPAIFPPESEVGTLWVVLYGLVAYFASVLLARLAGPAGMSAVGGIAFLAFTSSMHWVLRPSDDGRWHDAVDILTSELVLAPAQPRNPLPHIYYVVLDGLARPDILRDRFGLSVEETVTALRERGVVVPNESRSNYSQTFLSLASSLNGQYLDPLLSVMGEASSREPLHRLIQESGAIRRLKSAGYRFVMIGSPTGIAPAHALADSCMCSLPAGPTELEHALLVRTPLRGNWITHAALFGHREHLLKSFHALSTSLPSEPHFVFAHILAPHPPFVLLEDGRFNGNQKRFAFGDGDRFPGTVSDYRDGYAAQAAYVLGRVRRLFDELTATHQNVIIIVHADHGSGQNLINDSVTRTDNHERLAIFSAYFASHGASAVLDTMSPVNALRWALNTALTTRLELLPDRSFVSPYHQPYRVAPVPSSRVGERQRSGTSTGTDK